MVHRAIAEVTGLARRFRNSALFLSFSCRLTRDFGRLACFLWLRSEPRQPTIAKALSQVAKLAAPV